MNIPSDTVQAAQRLLAERERVGLAKYCTTVDRTDLQAGDWLQHAIEEASDLLLYLIRLQQMMPRTPDSDLPTLSSFAGIAPVTDFNLYTSPLSAPAAAPEDAERAAYLARWKDAPEWAQWLAQDPDGRCDFFESMPAQDERGVWKLPSAIDFYPGSERYAGHNLLGPFRCEPRPVQGVGK